MRSLRPSAPNASNPYSSTRRERGRERNAHREVERERARTGKRAAREKADRRAEYRHKLHTWLGFGSRQLFLFVGFLRLSRRLGYTLQMKVRLLGEKKCPGLQTSSTLQSVCVRAAPRTLTPWPLNLWEHREFLDWKRVSRCDFFWGGYLDAFGNGENGCPIVSRARRSDLSCQNPGADLQAPKQILGQTQKERVFNAQPL